MLAMKAEPKATLNVRNFPVALRRKCKAMAAMEGETLEQFVQRVLREATKGIAEPKSK
jgi:plasmid stability protein